MSKNMRTKLEFALLLAVVLAISLFAIITTFNINRAHYNMLRYPSARVQAVLRLPTGFTELRRLSTSVAAWTGNTEILPYLRADFYATYANLTKYVYLLRESVTSDPYLTKADTSALLAKLDRFQYLITYYSEEIAEPTFVAAMADDFYTVLSFGPVGYPIHNEITLIYTALIDEAQQTIYEISTNMNTTAVNMMIVMAILAFLSIIIGRRNERSKVLILHQNELQKSHILQLAENQEQIKILSHDFKQKVEAMRILNELGKLDELTAYLAEMSHSHPISIMLDTGNTMVDAVLSAKETEALRNQIEFTLKMDIPQGIPDISIDVCTLLGNALDNAIEACMKAPIGNRFINAEIRATQTQFLCLVINTFAIKPRPDGSFLRSSKSGEGNHGIGLRSMKQTCDALGGDLSFEYTDTHFRLQIYLPIKQKLRQKLK